jgi:hypothetical protein
MATTTTTALRTNKERKPQVCRGCFAAALVAVCIMIECASHSLWFVLESLVQVGVCWRTACCANQLIVLLLLLCVLAAGVSSSDDDDDDDAEAGWGSGDVLLGVPLPTLEALYQKYLTEPDYLDKVGVHDGGVGWGRRASRRV